LRVCARGLVGSLRRGYFDKKNVEVLRGWYEPRRDNYLLYYLLTYVLRAGLLLSLS